MMKLNVGYVEKVSNHKNVAQKVEKKIGDPHLICRKNRIVKYHCQLTGPFKGLAHSKCNLNTRQSHASFVPTLLFIFSVHDSHLIFQKLFIMHLKKIIKINGEVIIAKSSENCISVETGYLKIWDSNRFLDASLDKFSTTLSSSPSLDAMGMEDELLKKTYLYEEGQTIESCNKPLKIGRKRG